MGKTKFWKFLHKGAENCIPEHYEQMKNNLMWARHFSSDSDDSCAGMVKHEQKWATHHMDAIRSMEKYVDGDTPQRVKDIIAEARETYEEIMALR